MVRYYPAGEKWHTFRNHSKDIRTIFAFAKETGDFRDGQRTDDFAQDGRYILGVNSKLTFQLAVLRRK